MVKKVFNNEGWKVAVAGEFMVCRSFAMCNEPEFLKIKEIMQESDACYGHLEMNFGDFSKHSPARGDWVGSFLLAEPEIINDLKWMGVDLMSVANNHSLDFGASGLLSTIEACKEAKIVNAGTGRDLEEAREPAYWEGPAGRVALISTATGNGPYEWANLPKGTMKARPGINPLRVRTKYRIPHEEAEVLRNIGRQLDVLRVKGAKVEGSTPVGLEDGEFRLVFPDNQSQRGSGVFVEGDSFGIEMNLNAVDLQGNLRSIKEAKSMADIVMVAHHFNISEGSRGDIPPKFAQEFAHAAIDAGADMYFGHGWHKTLGIEIYKDKPIFYGLGNFFAQSQFIRRVPYDSYETWNHDIRSLPLLNPADEPLHPGLDRISQTWWSSVLIEVKFDNEGNVCEIIFYPVEMGRNDSNSVVYTRKTGQHAEGRPLIATGESAFKILKRLQNLSKPLGTKITIDGDIGKWKANNNK